jgi:hypothetical protein
MKVRLSKEDVYNDFKAFLEENDAKFNFFEEAMIDDDEDLREYVYSFVKSGESFVYLIDFAFTWSDTDQGEGYWSGLNEDWETHIYYMKRRWKEQCNSIWS